jgi:small-conductance mechanosensitive channel
MKLEKTRHNTLRLSFPLLFARLTLACLPAVALAQRRSGPGDTEACAACGTCAGGMIIVPLVIIALNIALLVWVARDAKSRGMDSSVLWMILVMVTSVIGLIIYLFSRPQGNLVRCASCNNQRLQASARCPHCGNA